MAEESIRFDEDIGGARESLAESHIMEQLNILLRGIEDECRELVFMVKDLDEGKKVAVDRRYGRVRNIKDSIEGNSINLMEYLIKVSPALTFKDIYFAMIQELVRTSEHIEAAAYRIVLLSKKEFNRMPDKLYALLEETVKKLMSMIGTISSMLNKLSMGVSNKVMRELYIEVVKAENAVDDYYRESGLSIIDYYKNDVSTLLLFKELFDKLEDGADLLKRVGNYIRYISLHR